MARVDFYILAEAGPRLRQTFACRLAEKAYRLANTVHIHAGSPEDAASLDDLLWTFRDGSFVPHEILGDATVEPDAPITIGCRETRARDLLINLDDDVPAFAGTFPRVAELVTADPACRQAGRRRFAQYRDAGHELETHNL